MLDGDDAPHDQLVADIVQCGHGDCKALRIDSLDGWRTTPKCKLLILLGLQGWLQVGFEPVHSHHMRRTIDSIAASVVR